MPPAKKTTTVAADKSRAPASNSVNNRASMSNKRPAPPQDDDMNDQSPDEEEEEEKRSIPAKLLAALLHDNFTQDGTRITKDASAAVGKYVDVFVREAIARAVNEKLDAGPFLEVDDLEKIAPQLLLDL